VQAVGVGSVTLGGEHVHGGEHKLTLDGKYGPNLNGIGSRERSPPPSDPGDRNIAALTKLITFIVRTERCSRTHAVAACHSNGSTIIFSSLFEWHIIFPKLYLDVSRSVTRSVAVLPLSTTTHKTSTELSVCKAPVAKPRTGLLFSTLTTGALSAAY
jgi:hypothetical protein